MTQAPPSRHLNPPPELPSDNIQSALFIPLHKVTDQHVGRKLRLVVQLVAVDPASAHAVVTTTTAGRPTLLVDLSAVLLGRTGTDGPQDAGKHLPDGAKIVRERLHLAPGEWVTLVGWLEASKLAGSVNVPPQYGPLPRAVLECIHVSMSRGPPDGAVCHGELGGAR